MKVTQQGKTKINTNIESRSVGVSEEGFGNIAVFLREKIYTDPKRAPIREYLANAIDESIKSGTDRPVEIGIRNIDDKDYFIVQDFATGMSDEVIEKNFSQYCASTKAKSNQEIGGFGIGSKSGHAYADFFNVISCNNGEKAIYSFVLNGDDVDFFELSREPFTDYTGVEIQIPIAEGDQPEFISNIESFFPFLGKKAILIKESKNYNGYFKVSDFAKPEALDLERKIFHLNHATYHGKFILMGFIPYRIDDKFFEECFKDTIDSFPLTAQQRDIIKDRALNNSSGAFFIKTSIGSTEPSLNRESISSTPKTRLVIKKSLAKWIKSLIDRKDECLKYCDSIDSIYKFRENFKNGKNPENLFLSKFFGSEMGLEMKKNNKGFVTHEALKVNPSYDSRTVRFKNGFMKKPENNNWDNYVGEGFFAHSAMAQRMSNFVTQEKERGNLDYTKIITVLLNKRSTSEQCKEIVYGAITEFFENNSIQKTSDNLSMIKVETVCKHLSKSKLKKYFEKEVSILAKRVDDTKKDSMKSQSEKDRLIGIFEGRIKDAEDSLKERELSLSKLEEIFKGEIEFAGTHALKFIEAEVKSSTKEKFLKDFGISENIDLSKSIIRYREGESKFKIRKTIPKGAMVVTWSGLDQNIVEKSGKYVDRASFLNGLFDFDSNEKACDSSSRGLSLYDLNGFAKLFGVKEIYLCTRMFSNQNDFDYTTPHEFMKKNDVADFLPKDEYFSPDSIQYFDRDFMSKQKESISRIARVASRFRGFVVNPQLCKDCEKVTELFLQSRSGGYLNRFYQCYSKDIKVYEKGDFIESFVFTKDQKLKIKKNNEKIFKECVESDIEAIKEAFKLDKFLKFVKIDALIGMSTIDFYVKQKIQALL